MRFGRLLGTGARPGGAILVTDTSHVQIDGEDASPGAVRVCVRGYAAFLRVPRIPDGLDCPPTDRPFEPNLAGLRHLGHACMSALQNGADQHHVQARAHRRLSLSGARGAASLPPHGLTVPCRLNHD
ncbi:hypothetical protein [Streptomyces sp. NPDC001714]|uniref:hypothetical protein n=1 Tax=Streptomyces sp. NPDC001714 TaxID=3364603 RepID=UPI0036894E70